MVGLHDITLLSVWILLSLKSTEVCFGSQLSYLLINLDGFRLVFKFVREILE